MGHELDSNQKDVIDQRAEHAYDKHKNDEKGLNHFLDQQKKAFEKDPNGAEKYAELVKHMADYSTDHKKWKGGDLKVVADLDDAGNVSRVEVGKPITQWESNLVFQAHSEKFPDLGMPQLEEAPKPGHEGKPAKPDQSNLGGVVQHVKDLKDNI